MKRFLSLLLSLVCVLCLANTVQADYSPVTAPLRSSLATRSGPSTDYNELGSYFQNNWRNISVRAYSKVQCNAMTWVQIEFSYNGVLLRAYTPESRLNMDTSYLPEEQEIGQATVLGGVSVQAYTGPGIQYRQTFYKVPGDVLLRVYDVENGFAQVDYTDSATFFKHRCWVPLDTVTYSGADYHRNINYVTPTPIPEPYDRRNSDDWGNAGHSDEWGSGVPYTGEVRFQENDTYLLRERADTGFIVTSNIDLNGCAMIELTVLGEISYHNLYLFMESADLGSFTTLDGREGTIRFFDDYALLSMDLRFAGIGEELVLRKAQENAW